jgi:hypothetical protein
MQAITIGLDIAQKLFQVQGCRRARSGDAEEATDG